jgi:hypothetical protein
LSTASYFEGISQRGSFLGRNPVFLFTIKEGKVSSFMLNLEVNEEEKEALD